VSLIETPPPTITALPVSGATMFTRAGQLDVVRADDLAV
jgi:hypothetical protein